MTTENSNCNNNLARLHTMKQFALSFLLTVSLAFSPILAQDTPDLDLPPELTELFKDGEIDPIKFQEVFATLPADQQEKLLKAAEAMMQEVTPQFSEIKHLVIGQVGQISFLLQDLGQQVEVNKKLLIPNKTEVESQIVALQQEVEELKRTAMSTALLDDPHILYNMILIIDELLRCIDAAVASKLTSIPAINTDNITNRSISMDDIAPEKLQAHVDMNEKRLEAIHKLTNDMGASWFNKTYKTISSKISPYNIFLGGVALGIVTYYMYRFSNDSFGAYTLDKDDNRLDSYGNIIKTDKGPFQKFCEITRVLPWWKKYISGEKTVLYDKDLTNNSVQRGAPANQGEKTNGVTAFGKTIEKLVELNIFNDVTTPLFTLGGICMLFQEKAQDAVKKARNFFLKMHAQLQGKEEYKAVDEFAHEPRFVLKDVEGHEHIKQELSILPAYFADPEKMDRTGKSPGRFWMLHGNSRTGKSMLGEAIAGEIKATLKAKDSSQKFTYVPITAEMLMLVGIEAVINYANNIKPCIICIDEFDLSGAQRERNSKLLAETLNAMGNAQLNDEVGNQVFFIFICNHIEHNDFALINRMDHIIEVNLPTLGDRTQFLIKELNKQFILVTPEFVDKLAQESEGKTIEELKRTITLAKQESFTSHQPVTEESLQKAFNQQIHKMVYSYLPAHLPFGEDQIMQLAAFQAGKALTISYGNSNLKIAQTTILGIRKKIHEESIYNEATLGKRKQKPKDWTKYGQVFTYRSQDALQLETYNEQVNAIKLKLAGHIAQEIVCGSQSTNYRMNAKNKAYTLARKVVFAGVNEMVLPKDVITQLKQETHELVMKCQEEVRSLLLEHKDQLIELSNRLAKSHIVSGAQIEEMLKGKPAAANIETPVTPTQEDQVSEVVAMEAQAPLKETVATS